MKNNNLLSAALGAGTAIFLCALLHSATPEASVINLIYNSSTQPALDVYPDGQVVFSAGRTTLPVSPAFGPSAGYELN
jgi:hypothetical protein